MADTLGLWGFTYDGRLKSIDFGAPPLRSSSFTRFRVKNQSPRLSALAVTVGFLDDPDPAWQFYLSTDEQTWTATVALGDLPAGSITGPIYLRRVTPSDAPTGPHTCRLVVTPTAWTA